MDIYGVKDNIKTQPPLRADKKRAGAKQLGALLAGRAAPQDLPPWLVIGDRVVMRWAGRHHVARVGEDGPFEAATKMYEQLRSSAR